MKKNPFLLALGLTIFVIMGASCTTNSPGLDTTTTTTTTEPSGKLALFTTTSPDGYSFSYPRLFTATLQPDKASFILTSPYSVTENPSGIPGNEATHPFQAEILRRAEKLDAALLKKDSPLFADSYTSYKKGKPVSAEDPLKLVTIDGKQAYSFQLGAEGINIRYIYLPVNEKETIVFKFSSLGDVLKASIQPKAIAEQEQNASFETILGSFTFVK